MNRRQQFCTRCGASVAGALKFCSGCAAPLPDEEADTERPGSEGVGAERAAGASGAEAPADALQRDSALTAAHYRPAAGASSQPAGSPPAIDARASTGGRNLLPLLAGLAVGALLAGLVLFVWIGRRGGVEADEGGARARADSASNVGKSLTATQPSSSPTRAGDGASQQPTAAAAPTPAVEEESYNPAAVERGVRSCLNGWVAATRAHDLNAHMSFYAPALNFYYRLSNVGVERVRADRARAFDRFTKLEAQLSNVVVTPDPAGRLATAVFDKSWNFEGDEHSTSGSVRQKLELENIGGRWLITGEKDLQIYYVNK